MVPVLPAVCCLLSTDTVYVYVYVLHFILFDICVARLLRPVHTTRHRYHSYNHQDYARTGKEDGNTSDDNFGLHH